MIRGFLLFLGFVITAAGAAWLADHPGRVSMVWQGYRVETSAAVLAILVSVFAAVIALVYRFWRALRRSPGTVAHAWRERTRRRGYAALSRGMVAVAAGDAETALAQVRRAEGLLGDPPLTLLLSAQAAQLAGDDAAAAGHFRDMLNSPETAFLGVRGLLTQALKRGDRAEALRLARRAWKLQPKSEWVAEQFFAQLTQAGEWAEAETLLDQARRTKALPAAGLERQQRVVRHQVATQLEPKRASKQERKIFDADPAFIPGALAHARRLLGAGKVRKAATAIEKTWALSPHPDLAALYWDSQRAADALGRLRAAEKLAMKNPDHLDSKLVMAEQALGADMWGEARRYLNEALTQAGTTTSARLCRLFATLEEGAGGNAESARQWLIRASEANPDPAWVCSGCGHVASQWIATCGHCGGFDTVTWTTPPHAPSHAAQQLAALAAALTHEPDGAEDATP